MSERPAGRRATDGRLRPTGAGAAARLGAASGWSAAGCVRPLWAWADGTAPIVTWLQVLALFLVAAILGAHRLAAPGAPCTCTAQRLEPHRAVNRLVLARACALVGALAAGGYVGYALSWVGDGAELADQRMVRSVIAGAGRAADRHRGAAARARLPGGGPEGRRVAPRLATGSFRICAIPAFEALVTCVTGLTS